VAAVTSSRGASRLPSAGRGSGSRRRTGRRGGRSRGSARSAGTGRPRATWAASTTAVSSPNWLCVSRTAAPKRSPQLVEDLLAHVALPRSFWRSCTSPRSASGTGSVRGFTMAGVRSAARDLVLKEKEAIEDRLGSRRAARDVDVAGDDLVDAGERRVVVVEAAAARAGPEGRRPTSAPSSARRCASAPAPGAG